MATQTSIEAYYEGLGSQERELQKRTILNSFYSLNKVTGNKIARHTGIALHLVFARLNDLKSENKVCQTGEKVKDKITKRKNLIWELS